MKIRDKWIEGGIKNSWIVLELSLSDVVPKTMMYFLDGFLPLNIIVQV